MNQRLRKGRVQTPGFKAVQAIQPAGLPGSTYVRPVERRDAGRDLYAIAEAFGGLSSSLSQLNDSRIRAAKAAEVEARGEARAIRADQREADTAARETARDAKAAATMADEQNKKIAGQMPWETFTLPQLQQVITQNDTPNGNPFALEMAATVMGKKAGVDFSNTLTDIYADYDPSSGQTVRQYLEGKSLEWLNENYNDLTSPQNRLARQGAWSVIDTHIKTLEDKEVGFQKNQKKEVYQQGLDAEAGNIIVDGKNKNIAPRTIAAEFLTSWSTFRKESTGDRANPEFIGVDANTPFKNAVQGVAESGDVELTLELLNTQVPGMRASLLKDPEHQKWAEETKAKAIAVSTEKVRNDAYASRANMQFLASKGELNDQIIKASVDSGVIKPAEAEDLMVKSRVAKSQAIAKAQAEAEKTKAEAASLTARDAITAGNLEIATTGGGLSGIQERTIPAKDGSGTTTVSVKDQLDDTTAAWEKQHSLKVEEVRASQGPEAAAEYDINSKIDFYGSNYQLENKQWKALFDNVAAGTSLQRWIGSGGKDVPPDVKLAFETYHKLAEKDPSIAAAYAKDEKTRTILEAYHIAQTRANAFEGGGVSTPEQAMGQALDIANRITNYPDTVKGIFWNDSAVRKMESKISGTGSSMFGMAFKGVVPADLTAEAKKLADFYARSGMKEDDAIARAVEVVKADYIQVNADWTGGGYLVNAKGIGDKEGFAEFLNLEIPRKLSGARGGPNDPALDAEDYIPVRVGDKWMLKAAKGNAILTNRRGEPVLITPADYNRYKDGEMWKTIKEAEDRANGKKGFWESVWNGLTNAEDRNRFWAQKEKWQKMKEQEALWEKQRIDREGGDGSNTSMTRPADLLSSLAKEGRTAAVEGLDPKTYDVASMDSGGFGSTTFLPGSSITQDNLASIVIIAESSGDPTAVSPTGDHFGLMQLGVDTGAVDAAKALGMADYVSADRETRIDMLMNPITNRKLGTQYLGMMLDKYDNKVEDALVAYNWGPGNADKWINGGRKWTDLPEETRGYVTKIMSKYTPVEASGGGFDKGQYTTGQYGTKVQYINSSATRNRPVTPTLEAKLDFAVAKVFGQGYTVKVFSGGQPKKGSGGARTGSTRHDDHGHGGRAADVYVYDPNGNKVRDRKMLLRLKAVWLSNGLGSVGTFMSDYGMHLDEITKSQLGAGQSLTWQY